jgi:hypothetical protein
MFVLVSSIVYSAPPFLESSSFSNEGIQIEFPLIEGIALQESYSFHFHIFNISNGVGFKEVQNCSFHLYDPYGSHIYKTNVSEFHDEWDLEVFIDGTNFSQRGDYNYIFQCTRNDGGNIIGGFLGTELIVGLTELTVDNTSSLGIIIFILFINITIFLVALFKSDWTNNEIVNLVIKRGLLAISIYMLTLNTAIVATLADVANLPIRFELLNTYMYIFGVGGYISLVVLVLVTFYQMLGMMMEKNKKVRMGED